METAELYYVTNRRHIGPNRWKPKGYGSEPSKDGEENLRFGLLKTSYDKSKVTQFLNEDCGFGNGNGEKLSDYFSENLQKTESGTSIEAFPEKLKKEQNEYKQTDRKLGSARTFGELQELMNGGCDVLIFIHGFNVDWWESVASALSLQFMLNRDRVDDKAMGESKPVLVVLFSWPSDGRAIPYWSYFSDRSDAIISGYAIGRGFLKLRDELIDARQRGRQNGDDPCHQSIHLLCHSMGNFVLQNAMVRVAEYSVRGKPPRIFDQIFLCAADVADDVFEPGEPMRRLPQMARNVTIYCNRGDLAMPVSDYTKGNTDRLGWNGADRPADLDSRVHQVDCSDIVTGVVEHSYYHCGRVNDDIRRSIDNIPPDSESRHRKPLRHGWPNVWRLY